jgi:hypothetical protein
VLWQKKHREDAEHYVCFVPRRTIECDDMLRLNGLLDNEHIKLHQFPIDLVPLEEDFLSMELPRSFASHMLEDDDSYRIYVHQSVMRLEAIFGPIKHKFAYGEVSKQIVDKIIEKEEYEKT